MTVKFTNNAFALVPAALGSADTTITVESGKGALFPVLGTGDYFYLTLVDVNANFEIVMVTARAGDTFTVQRAQEGTTAIPFPANSRAELRITAATLTALITSVDSYLLL